MRVSGVLGPTGRSGALGGTTEMIVAGLVPQVADALEVTIGQVGLIITVFAIGMMIGAPLMALATLRPPRKSTLLLALLVFAAAQAWANALLARFSGGSLAPTGFKQSPEGSGLCAALDGPRPRTINRVPAPSANPRSRRVHQPGCRRGRPCSPARAMS